MSIKLVPLEILKAYKGEVLNHREQQHQPARPN
jgi:hypothetical protein